MSKVSKTQCVGRDCGAPIVEEGKAMRFTEAQCDRACAEGSNLCKICMKREEANLGGKPGKWHGRIGGPLPPGSHIVGSDWNIATAEKEARLAAKKATAVAKPATAPKTVKAAAAVAVSAAATVKVAATAAAAAARSENVALARAAGHADADQRLQASLRALIAKTTAEVATMKERVLNSSEDLQRRIAAAEAAAAAAEQKRLRATVKAAKVSVSAAAPAKVVKAATAAVVAATRSEDAALERVATHVQANEKLQASLRAVIAKATADVAAMKVKVLNSSEDLQRRIAAAEAAAGAAEAKRLRSTVKAAKSAAVAVSSAARAVTAARKTRSKSSSGRRIYQKASKAAASGNLNYMNRWTPPAAGLRAPPASPHLTNSNFNSMGPGRTNSSSAFSNASVPFYNVAAAEAGPFNARRHSAVAAASRLPAALARLTSSDSSKPSSSNSSSGSSSSGSSSSGSRRSGSRSSRSKKSGSNTSLSSVNLTQVLPELE